MNKLFAHLLDWLLKIRRKGKLHVPVKWDYSLEEGNLLGLAQYSIRGIEKW